jgi:spermidine/putrescine transport system substrate-binding protein
MRVYKKILCGWWRLRSFKACYFVPLFLIVYGAPIYAGQAVLNVYAWAGYLPKAVLQAFTRETGIQVNYSTYESNEALYAKLKTGPHSGYDIIMPSSYCIARMRREGMLLPLDKNKLFYLKQLQPVLLDKADTYDPGNQYSIPYLWSVTGLVINSAYHHPGRLKTWQSLWQADFKDKLLLLDDAREVFSVALLALGYSPNARDPEQIQQAYLKLKQLMPNVRVFSSEGIASLYIDEELTAGIAWNGDVYRIQQENPAVQFYYPQEGYILSIDNLAVPIGAKHIEYAYQFINFLLRPEVAACISLETGYATSNQEARHYLPLSILRNPIIYPDESTLPRGIIQEDVGEALRFYEQYWDLLKMGG